MNKLTSAKLDKILDEAFVKVMGKPPLKGEALKEFLIRVNKEDK